MFSRVYTLEYPGHTQVSTWVLPECISTKHTLLQLLSILPLPLTLRCGCAAVLLCWFGRAGEGQP